MLFPELEVSPGCQAYPPEWFPDYFMLFVLLTTEFFWEDWEAEAIYHAADGSDLARSWCAIAQGDLPALPSALPKQADQNDLCLWFDGERKARNKPPFPTQPISFPTPKGWFPDSWWFGTLQADRMWRQRGRFFPQEGRDSLCAQDKQEITNLGITADFGWLW